jgi:opacity protein-like surface antigen
MSSQAFRITLSLAAITFASPSFAQSPLSFSIGGGPTIPAKHTGSRFDTGFNLTAGLGIHPMRRVGVMAEFGFYNMGITRTALNNIGVPNGSGRVYSLTLNPMVHLVPRGPFDAYIIGGGGYYRRTVEFTEPATGVATAFDPFYGIYFPVEFATNNVLGSFTQNKMGVNLGAGVAVRLGQDSRSTIFAESRYHYIYTSPIRTSILPVTFGFRW